MKAPPITPLEAWSCRKIGLAVDRLPNREGLKAYQLRRLNQTLAGVRGHSPFYREKLRSLPPEPLETLEALADLPFTSAAEIRQDPLALLCVSQGRIARAVSLETSGTTGSPKRIFFTPADLEMTIDFFHHGMATLVSPGQRVLILLPGRLPDSVGDLLCRALGRMNVQSVLPDLQCGLKQVLEILRAERIGSIVGTPSQIIGLVRSWGEPRLPRGQIRSILLTTDYVPRAIVSAVREAWGSRVFQHYGMTEMGYGGAVDCALGNAYHLREADLFFEVVDPDTGRPLPEVRWGRSSLPR